MSDHIDKSSITFLSGSAGELDWVLPILDDLLLKGFTNHICCLTPEVQESINQNKLLREYINRSSKKIFVHECFSSSPKIFDQLVYYFHRISVKLGLRKLFFTKRVISAIDSVLTNYFLQRMPKNIYLVRHSKNLIFTEFPTIRRPLNIWLKKNFKNSLFFYIPHSPHFYSENINDEFSEGPHIDYSYNSFLLLGHPLDHLYLEKLYDFSDLETVFLGHPKYSKKWLEDIKARSAPSKVSQEEINIFVISRGVGSYLTEEKHQHLVQSTYDTIKSNFSNYNLLIKKHPRELNSAWDYCTEIDQFTNYTDEHILQAAADADLVISFWSSGAMDCFALGVPVIEFFNPDLSSFQQVQLGNSKYTTIYRLLGCVLEANDQIELNSHILELKKNNFHASKSQTHPRMLDLLDRSNSWEQHFAKILYKNDLL